MKRANKKWPNLSPMAKNPRLWQKAGMAAALGCLLVALSLTARVHPEAVARAQAATIPPPEQLTATPTATATDTPAPTPTEEPTVTPTATPEPTATPSPTVTPTSTPTPSPCEEISIQALWVLHDADLTLPGTQVQPLPDAQSEVQIWLVTHGVYDVAVAGTVTNQDGSALSSLTFGAVADNGAVATALQKAVASGFMDERQRAAIADALAANQAEAFVATIEISSHSPPADYGVEAWLAGAFECDNWHASVRFTYLELVKLAFDFGEVGFGLVEANMTARIEGDQSFAPGDGRPTIRNAGNVPVSISLSFTPMVHEEGTGQLEDFRASLLGEELWVPAGETVTVSGMLPAGGDAAIDFWLIAPPGVPAGHYKGRLDIDAQRG